MSLLSLFCFKAEQARNFARCLQRPMCDSVLADMMSSNARMLTRKEFSDVCRSDESKLSAKMRREKLLSACLYLFDPSENVRADASYVILNQGSRSQLRLMRAAIHDESDVVRSDALHFVANWGGAKELRKVIAFAIRDPDHINRRDAYLAIGEYKLEEYRNLLAVISLSQIDDDERVGAIVGLALLGDIPSKQMALSMLDHESHWVRAIVEKYKFGRYSGQGNMG
jgi:hypothetical protein